MFSVCIQFAGVFLVFNHRLNLCVCTSCVLIFACVHLNNPAAQVVSNKTLENVRAEVLIHSFIHMPLE
jgi:hypothetical protein